MAVILKLENDKMLADIERARGNLTPEEFVLKCIGEGVRFADLERLKKADAGKPAMLNLGEVAPELAKVDRDTVVRVVTDISEQLKHAKESNPIYGEVKRLVEKYTALLTARKQATGGRPIEAIESVSLAPIQHFALEIALQSVQKEPGGMVRTVTKH